MSTFKSIVNLCKSISWIIISLWFDTGHAQVINIGQFNESYYGLDALMDDDGNHIVFMRSSDTSRLCIAKLDFEYNVIWNRTIEDTALYGSGKLVALPGNLYMGYLEQDGLGNAHIFRFDSSGDIHWHRKLGNDYSVIRDMLVFDDTKVLLSGGYMNDEGVSAMDVDGNILWSISTHCLGSQGIITAMTQTQDNQLLLIGYLPIGNVSDWKTIMVKVDHSGNVIWRKVYPSMACNSLVQGSDNNYYLLGTVSQSSSPDPFAREIVVRKFDELGSNITAMSYGDQFDDRGHDIIEDEDGHLVVIGLTRPVVDCAGNLLIMKLDKSLDTLFTRIYGDSSGFGANFFDIHQNDEGYYFCGSGNLWSAMSSYDAHLVKTDNSFEFGCSEYAQPFNLNEIATADTISASVTYSSLALAWDSGFSSIGERTLNVIDACPNVGIEPAEKARSYTHIYPNPTSGHIRIDLGIGPRNGSFKVFNSLGGQIDFKKIVPDYFDYELPQVKGIYYIQLLFSDGILENWKVVKQ